MSNKRWPSEGVKEWRSEGVKEWRSEGVKEWQSEGVMEWNHIVFKETTTNYHTCCVRDHHKTNIHDRKNPWHPFGPQCLKNVVVKFCENLHLKRWYSRKKLLQDFAVWIVVNISCLYFGVCQYNLLPANDIMAPLVFIVSNMIFTGILRQ